MAIGRHGPGKLRSGGDEIGGKPTDRAKNGVKRSSLVNNDGASLAAIGARAIRNDMNVLEATLETIGIDRPEQTEEAPQHLCLDKCNDNRRGTRL